jgi:GNAT superfamily N-acetyltransferase
MIQTIEEISLNAWPSLQQILYDGWILRFANGHTKRANSVNPVYMGSKDVYEKIKRCEKIYIEKNLQPIFRITPIAHAENLDEMLASAGFEKKDVVSVQVINLVTFQPQATNDIRLEAEFSQAWLDSFVQLSGVTLESQQTLAGILRNIAPKKCLAVLLKENQVVACGLGVLENQYIGLFEIVTALTERRKGFGKELILNILAWGKQNGAKKAYLQVVMNNEPALNHYSKLGFQEVYQYFYRIKVTGSGG